MKIVADKAIPFLRGVFEPYAEVLYRDGASFSREDVHDADALVTRTRTRCNAALLEGSSVSLIASATIGLDHIDASWCNDHGISFQNAPGCNAGGVVQYVFSAIFGLADRKGLDLDGLTLGIVGVGNVGRRVASVATRLGFKVLLNDPPRARKEGSSGFVSLDEIVRSADIITCHVPLIRDGEDATYHLFDRQRLSSLRPDQILINSSRGEVVDNLALKAVLKAGGLRAASLDVWENEPDIDTELLDLLFTGTPHIAGYSLDGKANGTWMSVQAVARALDLPCKDWKVNEIPLPAQAVTFRLNAAGRDTQDVLSEAILYTYQIREDDRRLRENPATFESQRADYPVRREFPAFTVNLSNATDTQVKALSDIGFKVNNK